MSRTACYVAGSLAMACLLLLAIFGKSATVADPYAARGALLAVFLAVHVRRLQCRALRRGSVAVAAFAGSFVAAAAGWLFVAGDVVGGPSFFDGAVLIGSSAATTLLMVLSFHYLTLRRGVML